MARSSRPYKYGRCSSSNQDRRTRDIFVRYRQISIVLRAGRIEKNDKPTVCCKPDNFKEIWTLLSAIFMDHSLSPLMVDPAILQHTWITAQDIASLHLFEKSLTNFKP
uniref:Uncharacterized protein n=1 Tax=Spongospora subterranea TaxID=70186 RepID=A0A0H5RET3_9EUKA|eukprot:CRZ12548.1 hypothetical protein [Spongospora subterranea]